MMIKKYSLLLTAIILVACNQSKTEKSEPNSADTNTIAEVFADFETEPVIEASDEDAADDPAFWFNAKDAEKSLILGSNKKLGLEVYTMQGQRIAHYASGRINNIDVVQGFNWGDTVVDIVAGSNRSYGRIDVWAIDSTGNNFQLVSDTTMRSELEDVYGFCLYHDRGANRVYAFINSKTGELEQWELIAKDSTATGFEIKFNKLRVLNAGKQVEGMVVDPKTNLLYVGVEEKGIQVFSALPEDSIRSYRLPLSGEDNPDLKFDIEGLAIHQGSKGNYLLASSQGNNRYAIFDLEDNAKYVKAFAVVDSIVDGCEETDGIDAISLKVGAKYPEGFMLIQDGFNYDKGEAKAQNFKLVNWQKVAEIL